MKTFERLAYVAGYIFIGIGIGLGLASANRSEKKEIQKRRNDLRKP